MEETNKTKKAYSKREKILRGICFAGIVICEIIGVLLFFINKPLNAIIILCACVISSFLVCSFITAKVKECFKRFPKKRVIYAVFYALIIMISMVTCAISCFNLTYSADEMAVAAIEFTEASLKEKTPAISIDETDIFDYFDMGNSYYYALETKHSSTETSGVVSVHYSVTYIKVNKYSGSISVIDFVNYENAKTFVK